MSLLRRNIGCAVAIALLAAGCSSGGDDTTGGELPDAASDATGSGDMDGGADATTHAAEAGVDASGSASPDGSDGAPLVETGAVDSGGAADTGVVDSGNGGANTDGGVTDAQSADSSANGGVDSGSNAVDSGSNGGDSGIAAAGSLCGAQCAAGEVLCGGFCYPAGTGCPACNADACSQNGKAMCNAQGHCQIVSCNAGWADCDGNPANGCEADLTSATTCGTCGNACSGGTPLCSSGTCAASCAVPAANCGTGRCVDRSTDPNNCGACGTGCPTASGRVATCSSGTCGTAELTCPSGQTLCNGVCLADMTTDPNNCGSCGNACPTGGARGPAVCANSQCVTGCPAGTTLCGSTCVAMSADTNHCGACGQACASGDVCQQGSCVTPSSLLLVTGQGTPDAIAVDDDHVYWMDTSAKSISSVPKAGGSVTTIVAQNAAEPFFLGQAGDSYLYYQAAGDGGSAGSVMRVLRDGTAAPQTFIATAPGLLIGVDAASLYFTAGGSPESVVTIPVSGGASSSDFSYGAGVYLVGGPSPVVVDGQVFALLGNGGSGEQFYEQAADLFEVHGPSPISGAGSCAYLITNGSESTASDYNDGYYGDFNSASAQGVDGATCTGGLVAGNPVGSTCGVLSQGTPGGACPTASCPGPIPELTGIYLSTVQQPNSPLAIAAGFTHIAQMVADSSAVYWTDRTGNIGKLALP